jgi:hypothetical protein
VNTRTIERTTCCALLLAGVVGCQNNRQAVMPPPGAALNRPDVYYTPPPGGAMPLGVAPTTGATAPVSLAPTTPIALPPPPIGTLPSGTVPSVSAVPPPRDTYNPAARLPSDSQPVRIVSGNPQPGTTPLVSRGMPVNDGTYARSWSDATLPPLTANNNLRGNSGVNLGASSYSAQEGQWRSRSSYEPTERR